MVLSDLRVVQFGMVAWAGWSVRQMVYLCPSMTEVL